MKKIICLVLCLIMISFCFTACKKSEPTSVFEDEETTAAEKGSLKDTVKITIPLALIEEEYQNDIDAYCEKYGYISATLNKKKETVTLVMNKFSHELLLTRIGMRAIGAIYDMENNDEYPCVENIESVDQESFSEVIVNVDREKYEKSGDIVPYTIGQYCLYYQLYTESTVYRCDVIVVDKDTKEIIETKTYTDKEE